jgi:hypothetical protein
MTEETYYSRNREKCLANSKAYLETHRDYYKEYHRAYYQANKQTMNEARRLYHIKHRQAQNDQRKTTREKKKIVFYETNDEPVVEIPIVLSCQEEIPRWSLVITEGCTLTFD